jgi:hypothetical protein
MQMLAISQVNVYVYVSVGMVLQRTLVTPHSKTMHPLHHTLTAGHTEGSTQGHSKEGANGTHTSHKAWTLHRNCRWPYAKREQ